MNDSIMSFEPNESIAEEVKLYNHVQLVEQVQFSELLDCARCGGECKVF